MSENNVAQAAPLEEERKTDRLGSTSISFMEVVAAIREQYHVKGIIELDSDTPITQGTLVAFRSKETNFVFARARAHYLIVPRFDKETGNLFTYLQFIDVSIGSGKAWSVAINTDQ